MHGHAAIESLGLLHCLNAVMNANTEQIGQQDPNLFEGLGKLEWDYTIYTWKREQSHLQLLLQEE